MYKVLFHNYFPDCDYFLSKYDFLNVDYFTEQFCLNSK